MSTQPIGLLDSGFGGLSVMSAIREKFPHEDLIYTADCGFAPWGDRDDEFIDRRVDAIVDYLLSRNIKALVLACNTATAVSATRLREKLTIPVIGIEPAVLPAARATQTKAFAVMATVKTIESDRYAGLKARVEDPEIQIYDCPCPGLMECVEAGAFHSATTRALISHFVKPLLAHHIDQIVLGCTHYPFLAEEIQALAGPQVSLIDPAPAVARHLYNVLSDLGVLNESKAASREEFYVSGANPERERVLRALWSPEAKLLALPTV